MQPEFMWAIIKVGTILLSSLCVLLVLAWVAAQKCFPGEEQSPKRDSSVTQVPKPRKSIAA